MRFKRLFLGARAAILSVVGVVLQVGHDFQEGRHVLVLGGGLGRGFEHGGLGVRLGARAAAESGELGRRRGLVLASRLLADELALGAGAHQRLSALPVAVRGLAERSALGLGGNAGGVADRGRADGLALGAVILLAQVLGASHRARRLLAVDIALGARKFLALHLALRSGADGVAHGRARRIVALPLALGVAANLGEEK